MKSPKWLGSKLTLALAGFTLALGCASDVEKSSASDGSPNAATNNSPSLPRAVQTDAEPTQTIAPEPVETSPGVGEVIKLVQANVEESVVLAYVDNSNVAYAPSADEILYLKDIGMSEKVIEAMIQHGKVLQAKSANTPGNKSDTKAVTAMTPAQTGAQPPPVAGPAVVPGATQPLLQSFPPPIEPSQGMVNAIPASYTEAPYSPVPYETPQPPVTINYFYEPLSPYGTWMEIPDYGWAWQPSAAQFSPEWRPYGDRGRWLYTDCGWYWQSDYSWGWAPFHYGRWLRHMRYGWVWFPDTVWGPAWVSWRSTPLYCGWAPLPPAACYEASRGFTYYGVGVGSEFDFGLGVDCFTFISFRHFCDRNPHGYYIPGDRLHGIYRESRVDNHYFLGPNKTIINEGVGRDRVANFTRGEIRKIGIRDLPASGKAVKPDRPERVGNSLVIYRPTIQPGPPSLSAPLASRGLRESVPGTHDPASLAAGKVNGPAGKSIARTGKPGEPAELKPTSPGGSVRTETVTRSTHGGVPTAVAPASSSANLGERQSVPLSPVPAYSGIYPNAGKPTAGATSPATVTRSGASKTGNGPLPPKVLEANRSGWANNPSTVQSPTYSQPGLIRPYEPGRSTSPSYPVQQNRAATLSGNQAWGSTEPPVARSEPYRQEMAKPYGSPGQFSGRDVSSPPAVTRGTTYAPAYNSGSQAPAAQRSITVQPNRSYESPPARSVQPVSVPASSPRVSQPSSPPPAAYSRPAPAPAPAPVAGRDPARDGKK
jgi:hypothetical protein